MKRTAKVLLLVLWASLAPWKNYAQDNAERTQTQRASGQRTSDQRPIEEINVTAERSLLVIRNQIERQEDSLYRLFNELNSADKFNIFCKSEIPTGSFIPVRSCEPLFLTNLRQQENRGALSEIRQAFSSDGLNFGLLQNGLDLVVSDRELQQRLRSDFEELQNEMFRIALENPEYLEQLQKLDELKKEYEAAKAVRFGSRRNED